MSENPDLLHQLRIDRTRGKTSSSRGPRMGVWMGVIVALVLVAGGAFWWWSVGRAVEVSTATASTVAGATASAAASVLDATGYITARRQATVSAKITGKVAEVLIEEGQRVEAGQVLARLEPIDAEAQRSLARSQLAAARSEVTRNEIQLQLAEKSLGRQRALRDRKLLAQATLDQAESERDALRAAVNAARRNVDVASDGVAVTDIGVDNTIVRAPFAGVIIAKAAQEGEIVSPISGGGGFTRTGIGTLVDMDSLEVQVDVNEAYIGRVKARMPVEAVLNAYPEWKIPAEVIAIVPTADRGKATVKVRIALLEKDPRIVPDMGVKVSFLERSEALAPGAAKPADLVTVPAAAVVDRDDAEVVFVVADRRAQVRRVTLGRTLGESREVRSGLRAGETVVLDPAAELKDGARVRESAAADEDNS